MRKAIEGWGPVGFFPRSTIDLKELSYLLWCTQGFKNRGRDDRDPHYSFHRLRNPLETYFVAGEVDGLETGCTRYLPKSHSIVAERIDSGLTLEMSTASLNFKLTTRAAVTFLWVAIPYL